MRWKSQVRFGGRRRGDHRPQSRHRRLAADPASGARLGGRPQIVRSRSGGAAETALRRRPVIKRSWRPSRISLLRRSAPHHLDHEREPLCSGGSRDPPTTLCRECDPGRPEVRCAGDCRRDGWSQRPRVTVQPPASDPKVPTRGFCPPPRELRRNGTIATKFPKDGPRRERASHAHNELAVNREHGPQSVIAEVRGALALAGWRLTVRDRHGAVQCRGCAWHDARAVGRSASIRATRNAEHEHNS